jgi:hypothetical protein
VTRAIAAIVLSTLTLAAPAFAQQIDVSTLPPREAVQLTIYNSEDLTLVRDVRHVTMEKGRNELQFSWANTLIDPTSVHFRSRTPGLEVVDTRFPHDRPQVLYWLVDSSFSGEALVEISYFTSGITWSADYVGVTDADERSMRFDGYVTISNESGETYRNAQIRMVVGEINLVESIESLASSGIEGESAGEDTNGGMSRLESLRDALDAKDKAKLEKGTGGFGFGGGGGGIFGDPGDAPEITKEGLSEYFIFTVAGTHDVRNEWEGRLRLFEGTDVPLATVYRFRPEEYGEDELLKVFLVKNDETNKLGTTPLPNGDVRLYRDRGEGSLGVVAFVDTKYVPIGQEFEFVLGTDPEVRWTHVDVATTRGDFWFQRDDAEDRLYSPTKGDRIAAEDSVAGWTTRASVLERVRNFRDRAIDVEFRVPFEGDVTFESSLAPTLYDFRTVDFKAAIPASATKDLAYVVETREGTNATEERVALRASPTAPQTPARAP